MGKIRPERNSGLSASWTHDLCNTMQCPASWANKPTGSWSLCWFVMKLWSDEQMTVIMWNQIIYASCELINDIRVIFITVSRLLAYSFISLQFKCMILIYSQLLNMFHIRSGISLEDNFLMVISFFCLQFLAFIVTTLLLIGIGMKLKMADLVPVLNGALLSKTMKNLVTKYKMWIRT